VSAINSFTDLFELGELRGYVASATLSGRWGGEGASAACELPRSLS
jgi:hypothetical protein